ncbi:MAG TPA: thioesterase family protein [Pirellulales bacterium]|jgi:acyl-CoA thioester hydrolase|nr:thioesterase family protein [Pirellulales bacterium]
MSDDPLAHFPAVIALPVQWGDQDAFLHVNNTVYLRWCESARIAYLDNVGLSDLMEREKIGPILAAITCNYRRPVTYPDTVRCGARISRLGRSSLTMEHRIYSEGQDCLVADAQSTLVVFDYNRQVSQPIPDDIRRKIEEIEGHRL